MSTTPREGGAPTYVMPNAGEQTPQRWAALEALYDGWTTQHLQARGIRAGWHCLEVGGGSGSIARWLAERVGPTGQVLATDLDPRFLEPLVGTNLAVKPHDITTDPLPEAAFDLVHTRLVLHHLAGRNQALQKMVAALRPGGWLVVEEFDWSAMVLDLHDAATAARFNPVQQAMWRLITEHGGDGTYGRQLWGRFRAAGLTDVGAEGTVRMWHGRSISAQLALAAIDQVAEVIVGSGWVTHDQVAAYRELWDDPDFAVMSAVLMTVWGRQPEA
jgi:SAM-dependent methyltransferase